MASSTELMDTVGPLWQLCHANAQERAGTGFGYLADVEER